jgi:Domain of unknown function (DUF397)
MMITYHSMINGGDPMNERKSKYSQGVSNCVEVGEEPGAIVVGDTQDPDGPKLAVLPADWTRLLTRCYGDG